MQEMLSDPPGNVCSLSFVGKIHRLFYENLPEKHQYTHNQGGFTNYSLKEIDARLDGHMRDRNKDRGAQNPLDPRAGKLLKALFLQGEIKRDEARSVMGMEEKSGRQARRIVSQLASEGLIQSDSHKAPLRIAFPTHVLRYYFPDLFDPSVLGEPKQLRR